MSDNETAEREGENDSDHASHVCLRDETAPCGWWHPPGGGEISFVVSRKKNKKKQAENLLMHIQVYFEVINAEVQV